jgi:hypothetical protein
MKITKAQLKQIIMEELEEVNHGGVDTGKLFDYLEKMLGYDLAIQLMYAVRQTDEDKQRYIAKLANEMIVSEGSSEMMSPREKQEAVQKEMETYLIDKGVYKGDRNGRISIMTGVVGEASDVLDDAVAKGLFDKYDVMAFINRLDRMIS